MLQPESRHYRDIKPLLFYLGDYIKVNSVNLQGEINAIESLLPQLMQYYRKSENLFGLESGTAVRGWFSTNKIIRLPLSNLSIDY